MNNLKKHLTLDNLIKLLTLILVVILIQFAFNSWLNRSNSSNSNKMVTIDLLKIQQDYMSRAVGLVTQINSNQVLTEQQKYLKAQNVLKVVGDNVQVLSDSYSQKNRVLVMQKQAVMSDLGLPLHDITNELESQIDAVINKKDLDNAAR